MPTPPRARVAMRRLLLAGLLSITSTVVVIFGTAGPASASNVTATMAVSPMAADSTVVYTVVLVNSSAVLQPDNPSNEFINTLPAGLTLLSASAATGAAFANTGNNTASWTGSIPAMSSVTITINARVNPAPVGTIVSTQGTVLYDANEDGTNESVRMTDDPNTGAPNDATSFAAVGANFVGTMAVSGVKNVGAVITYTVTMTNDSTIDNRDNPSNEFITTLPSTLTLLTTTAPYGSPFANTGNNSASWSGPLPAGATVTITVRALIETVPAGTVITSQGTMLFDRNRDGTNESVRMTDDPSTGAVSDATSFTTGVGPNIVGTKSVAGPFDVGSTVTYSIGLQNTGVGSQTDRPGDELVDVLPAGVQLIDASATAGTASASTATNTVNWNGGLASEASVTITVRAVVRSGVNGAIVANQAQLSFDDDLDLANEVLGVTDDPNTAAVDDPTAFVVVGQPNLVPVSPARVLETRIGPDEVTVDGRFQGIGARPAGTITEVQIAGRANVPADATAVFLNVTAIGPGAPGYLTIYPCGQSRPLTSNVNYTTGAVVPNAVLAKVGVNGAACVFTLATTDVVIDVNGYVPAKGAPDTIIPARVLETRIGPDERTVDGRFQGIGALLGGTVAEVQIAGRVNVPSDASAAFLNVTAIGPGAPGYLTIYPCGQPRPLTSNVNYTTGAIVPNAVLAKVGLNGTVCIFTLATTDVVIDVNGYVPAKGTPDTTTPARVLETRVGPDERTVDGRFQGIGALLGGTITEVQIAGRANVPTDATAAFLNVTAIGPSAPGYLTLYPCGQTRPLTSNVNYTTGAIVPNAVLAKVGLNGTICIFTLATTDVIVDVNGYVPNG